MRSFGFIFFVIPVLILLDLYVYKGIRKVLRCEKPHLKSVLFWFWWVFSAGMIAGLLVFLFKYEAGSGTEEFTRQMMKYNGIFIVQIAVKVFYAIFELIRDINVLIIKIFPKKQSSSTKDPISPSRREFIRKTGVIASVIPFVGLIHGIGWGRFNFTIHSKKLYSQNLPEAFNGLKIVQLSDAHLGSLNNHKEKIEEVVDRINELNPDLIMFTGDMVNNFSSEMSGWVPIWKRLKARYGKFSVLGNHDYGNYSEWPSPQAKKKNLLDIIRQEKEMGFRVLLNENQRIEKDGQNIVIAGVENWGNPPFPQHGKIDRALENVSLQDFTILLSHDPDHWEKKVIPDHRTDVTLSGHTHGFQMGIEIGNFKISPVQLRYKHWAGLYKMGHQYLYVNRGLGYLAFPGRVGIWPEITFLELHKSS
jgi:predicted MPP superfamily phosphohydrolase